MALNDTRTNVLLPLDYYSTLCKMSDEQVGRLVRAAYEYILFDTIPSFEDSERIDSLWDRLQPKLDIDGTKWIDKKIQSRYASWCNTLKETGSYLKIPFDEWKLELKRLEEYCENLPPSERPNMTTWIQRKHDLKIDKKPREIIEDEDEGTLPFD